MATAVGQVITKVITIRDGSNIAIEGLLEDDFAVLEAYLVSLPATTATVVLDEIGGGQYALSFVPSVSGDWALHYVYEDGPVFREDTSVYPTDPTAEIVVVTSGGTWTYAGDLEDPSQLVRFIIQDTDGDHPQFTDAEVAYALGAANGVARRAAASLLETLMIRYAQMADTTELDLSVRASQIYEHYKEIYTRLTGPFSGANSAVPYAGGISRSDIDANRRNKDRVSGVFDRTNTFDRRDWGGIR